MRYFVLKNSTGSDIGKEYPQTNGMNLDYQSSQPNSISFLPNLEKPNIEPNFDYFILSKKAKLTDFISTGLINATGFLVNHKVKDIVDLFFTTEHKFYPAKILAGNKFLNYFWLHFIEDATHSIDFNNSIFELKSPLTWDIWTSLETNIIFTNFDDLLKKHSEKEVLDQFFPINIGMKLKKEKHIITFKYLGTRVLVSEDFANELQEKKITGYELSSQAYPVTFYS